MALQQLWNINGGGPPFAFDGEGHRMPAIITTRAGEPVLSLSQPLPLPQDQADPEERRIHALQEAARERMHNLFLSVGVVLSQLLREGRSIPDFLADPIFLSVLIDSDWRQLSDAELHAACRQQGLAMHTLNGADLREAIEENVVQPRAGPLASIKEGWNIVSVSDCLRGLDWATIRACFVGVSAFDARDVLQRVQLGWQHEVEEGRRETDHFQAVVTAAFLLPENEGGFSVEDARLLVQFVCARSHLDSQPIVIKAVMPSDPDRPVAVIDSVQWAQMVEGGRTKYPEGHLLRSHTCFNTLDLTYINSPDIFTPINVVRNIRHSIIKSAEFGGTSFGEE